MSKATLILRPADQAEPLLDRLQQHGAQVLQHSMVSVEPSDTAVEQLEQLLEIPFTSGIMVSVNAAHFLAKSQQQLGLHLPKMNWFSVGPTSARAIAEIVQGPVTCPLSEHNSEGLLRLKPLQNVKGQEWLIVRGERGRELLADTLRARGAKVHYLDVYRRMPTQLGSDMIQNWQAEVDCIMVSSAEQLGYFLAAIPADGLSWLQRCQWIVASDRLQALLPVGLQSRATVAGSATPHALIEAWQQVQRKQYGEGKAHS
ncbi:uroporphyrinogen-III synthase [Pseudidiomarina taiwanensis]|uniref:Uroporphyrinogen-III synthase n=1 Tax=Pseudidiomarina taiwanensis TaxID=337250 RepID=A0A432ZF79_9GAMM|nr:uroporphyrinogen-III synthase [Pseudidiomarina taiwanensis]RUO76627.1 uroporphyrinogen-III synthase [Pseudidiomarina taiwanensis]